MIKKKQKGFAFVSLLLLIALGIYIGIDFVTHAIGWSDTKEPQQEQAKDKP